MPFFPSIGISVLHDDSDGRDERGACSLAAALGRSVSNGILAPPLMLMRRGGITVHFRWRRRGTPRRQVSGTIPPVFGAMKELRILWFHHNHLEGAPAARVCPDLRVATLLTALRG